MGKTTIKVELKHDHGSRISCSFNQMIFISGLDWYISFFPVPKNSTAKFLFEKSATYFDGELVPRRVHALLPKAKLVGFKCPTLLLSIVKIELI